MNKRFLYEIIKLSGLLKYFPSVFCLLKDGSIDIISNCCIYKYYPIGYNEPSLIYIEYGDGNIKILKEINNDSRFVFCTSEKLAIECIKTNDYSKSIAHIYNNIHIGIHKGYYENYIVEDQHE